MSKLRISPKPLTGSIAIPPSKSIAHRAVICSGLSGGTSMIEHIEASKDITATIKGMSAFGSVFTFMDSTTLKIQGNPLPCCDSNNMIDCNESGSTLRFLLPLFGVLGNQTSYTASKRLFERPLDSYYDIFKKQGIIYAQGNPLTVEGKLKSGIFTLPGNISSQFISGLLFTLPLLAGNSQIKITTSMESKGYIDLTIAAMAKHGILVENEGYQSFFIKGNQSYQPTNTIIEGDFSQGAFFMVAGALGAPLRLLGLQENSLQGDKEILLILQKMGAAIQVHDQRELGVDEASDIHDAPDVYTVNPTTTVGSIIDVSQCPDLVPILAVLCALSKGKSEIIGAARLRIKESDRLTAITTELKKLGADIVQREDSLIIHGKNSLTGGEVDSWNDHRIAMALAIASIRCSSPVILNGWESVSKSYPNFWNDFKSLGGEFDELNMGH